MKKFIDDLKTAFDGLAYADLGELRTQEQKNGLLSRMPAANELQQRMAAKSTFMPSRHIVLAIEDTLTAAAMKYAISTCQRMEAGLDVLCNTSRDSADTALAPHLDALQAAGVPYQIIVRRGPLQQVIEQHTRSTAGTLLVVAGSGLQVQAAAPRSKRAQSSWQLDFPLVVVMDNA